MIELTKSNFKTVVNNVDITEKPLNILVEFGAPWCQPCRTMEPVIERLAKKHAGKIVVGHVDIDREPELAAIYDIMSVPTFLVFLKGVVIRSLIGAVPEAKLERLIG